MAFSFRSSGSRGTRMQIDKFAGNSNWVYEAMALKLEFLGNLPVPVFVVFAILLLTVGQIESVMGWALLRGNPLGGPVKFLLEGGYALYLLFRGRTLLKAGKSDLSLWETLPVWLSFLPGLLLVPLLGLLPGIGLVHGFLRPMLNLWLVTPLLWLISVLLLTGLGVGTITTAFFGRLIKSRQTVEDFTLPLLRFVIAVWLFSLLTAFVGESVATGGLALSRVDIPAVNQQQDEIWRAEYELKKFLPTPTPFSFYGAPPVNCPTYPRCPTQTPWRPGQNK